jgi:hypothetical protein
MKNKLIVVDDEEEFSRKYARELGSLPGVKLPFSLLSYTLKDFKRELEILGKREEKVRSGQSVSFEDSEFDQAAVVVVDFELPKAFEAPSSLTGERICYLLRCYSSCGALLGVDQFIALGDSPFDLTLRGNPGSFADVNVTAAQLTNPGLWGGNSDFRPWYWPNVAEISSRLDRMVESVGAAMDKPLGEVLGLGDSIKNIPDEARDFLGSRPDSVTPRSFVMQSGKGIQGRTEKATDGMIARIAAARLSKWFERLVLPGQDVLVDAPHLVVRFPSLLANAKPQKESWDMTAALRSHEDLGLRWQQIEQHRLKDTMWLSRPVWLASDLSRDKNVAEVADPFSREPTPFVFAEDGSRFYPERDCHPFKANVDSPYVRRYIKQFDGVEYTPIDNLEM